MTFSTVHGRDCTTDAPAPRLAQLKRDMKFQAQADHRRVRAAIALGRQVQAIVRPMSDAELVVAQGIENAVRKNLSFIERALFAKRLADAGHGRAVISEALVAARAEVSRLLSVARGVPLELVEVIGPAPKVGRARWRLLTVTLEKPEIHAAVMVAAQNPALANLDTVTRFNRLFRVAQGDPHPSLKVERWKSASGRMHASVTQTPRSTTLAFKKDAAEFGRFVLAQLDELEREFSSRRRE